MNRVGTYDADEQIRDLQQATAKFPQKLSAT
jgi:hypothetical protein